LLRPGLVAALIDLVGSLLLRLVGFLEYYLQQVAAGCTWPMAPDTLKAQIPEPEVKPGIVWIFSKRLAKPPNVIEFGSITAFLKLLA
jgi:hypothetical protein